MKIVAAIHDLMFSSKVNIAARGHTVSWLPRGTSVAQFVAQEKPEVLLIDLGAAALGAVEAIRAVKAAAETKGTRVIGYLGHEEAALMEAARAAGCDQVMSKGEFARKLPDLLK